MKVSLRVLATLLISAVLSTALATVAPSAVAAPAPPLTVGANDVGLQGNGTTAGRSLPGPVTGPAAVAVASGRDHAYLLDQQSRVWSWGNNTNGQIGDGTTVVRRSPVQLALASVTQIEAGHYHGIALRSDGTVWTWGLGTLGQLGLGTTTNRSTPTQVSGLSGIVAVAAGRDMSYALRSDGTVAAWGSNALGEVGDGTTTRRLTPVTVPGLTGVVELSGGRNHALVRTATGAVWSWGDNRYGQLGDGTTVRRLSPVNVITSAASAVDAGAHHSVAARSDGTVLTWGRGYRGQLGLGSLTNRLVPTAVPGIPAAVEVGDGRDQTFAITADGRVWAWGDNRAGQLGDGTTNTRSSPVLLGVTGIAVVQSGATHTVFLPADGDPPANTPPTASFSASCTALACTFDATASQDVDGTIASYAWSFGDGGTGSGPDVQHDFAAAGTYPVVLTVTDDDGAVDTEQRDLVVDTSGPPATVDFVAAAAANVNARTHRVTIPTAVQEGDGLVLLMTTNTSGQIPDPTGVTGWVGVEDIAGADFRTRAWELLAGAGDGGRTVTVTLPAFAKASVVVAVYRGNGPDVVTASASTLETVSRATHTTPPVPVTVAGSMLVSAWADKTLATTTMSAPPGTDVRVLSTGSSGGRITALVADTRPAVGTAGGLPATADATSAKATMLSLVIAPQ